MNRTAGLYSNIDNISNMKNIDNIINRRQNLIDMAQGKPPRVQTVTQPDGQQSVLWHVGRGIIRLPLQEYLTLNELANR
jgi:hypothetical protein